MAEFYPEKARSLDFIIRSIIGMDAEIVKNRFEAFARKNSGLSSRQISFLRMLQSHIGRYGSIEIDKLYEAPFTTLASDGIDGVFDNEKQVDELIDIIETFGPPSISLPLAALRGLSEGPAGGQTFKKFDK